MPKGRLSRSRPKASRKALKVVASKSQKSLSTHAAKRGSVRVGATSNIAARAKQYKNAGYRGRMYVTKTSNMKAAENKLLKKYSGKHNVQKKSSIAAKPGYVYAIKGQKRSKK